MMYRVARKFDAAHMLPLYKGPCCNIHGHTWRAEFLIIELDSTGYDILSNLDNCGIGVDFKILKQELDSILPDHMFLNQIHEFTSVSGPPSAERLGVYLRDRTNEALEKFGLQVMAVELWESDDCSVVISRGDRIPMKENVDA